MQKNLFSFIEKNKDEYVNFLKDICSFEATAREKEDVDKMMDFIEDYALKKGFSVKRTPFETCGDFLTIDINEGNEKGNFFLAHVDTVHKKGVFGYPCVKIDNNKMIAPGAIDCKGGVVIALLTMDALKQNGFTKHTRLILTTDEEVSNVLGGEKEIEFIKESVKGFKSALNCETTEGNEIVVSRKGILRREIIIKGKGGHSGIDYFRASSAVREAAYKIIELEQNSKVGGTTYNCSVINGGRVYNCIPDECSFVVDVRAMTTKDLEEADLFVQKVASTSFVNGTSASVKNISKRMPMVRDLDTEKLFNDMQKISQKYGLGELIPVESGGGSDSAYTQAAGVPSLCGVGGSGEFCHTNKEYIDIDSIEKRAKMLSAFCVEI